MSWCLLEVKENIDNAGTGFTVFQSDKGRQGQMLGKADRPYLIVPYDA